MDMVAVECIHNRFTDPSNAIMIKSAAPTRIIIIVRSLGSRPPPKSVNEYTQAKAIDEHVQADTRHQTKCLSARPMYCHLCNVCDEFKSHHCRLASDELLVLCSHVSIRLSVYLPVHLLVAKDDCRCIDFKLRRTVGIVFIITSGRKKVEEEKDNIDGPPFCVSFMVLNRSIGSSETRSLVLSCHFILRLRLHSLSGDVNG